MYEWRGMSDEQRASVLDERKQRGYPWHSPPHIETHRNWRIVTATCYNHQPVLNTPARLQWFEGELLKTLREIGAPCAAWCVIPYHYHTLIRVSDVKLLSRALGNLHGRTSKQINDEDGSRGRKNWYRSQDRIMRSLAHYYTSLNYIHHNPVKHGYVEKWTDWPFSSAHWYLSEKGRAWLYRVWREYPLKGYGDKWDV